MDSMNTTAVLNGTTPAQYKPGDTVVFAYPLGPLRGDCSEFYFGTVIEDTGDVYFDVAYLDLIDGEPRRCWIRVARPFVRPVAAADAYYAKRGQPCP